MNVESSWKLLAGTAPAFASGGRTPLWKTAARRGLVYGSSWATWESDSDYLALLDREAAMLLTEDDLLWYRLKPSRDAPLDFSYGDQVFAHADAHRQLVFGAHLVWDEGFGDGWGEDELWSLSAQEARDLLYPIIRKDRAALPRPRGGVELRERVRGRLRGGRPAP